MRNIKGGRKPIIIKLGKVNVTKKILMDVEKIILKRITPADHWVTIDKPKGFLGNEIRKYDWARQVPNDFSTRWASIRTKGRSVRVEFTPRKTIVIIQRIYAKGEELNSLNSISDEILIYLNAT